MSKETRVKSLNICDDIYGAYTTVNDQILANAINGLHSADISCAILSLKQKTSVLEKAVQSTSLVSLKMMVGGVDKNKLEKVRRKVKKCYFVFDEEGEFSTDEEYE